MVVCLVLRHCRVLFAPSGHNFRLSCEILDHPDRIGRNGEEGAAADEDLTGLRQAAVVSPAASFLTRDPQSCRDEPRGQRSPGNPRQGLREIVEVTFDQFSGRQAILAKASAKSSSLPSIKSVETSVAHLSSRSFGHQLQEQFAKTRDVYSGVLLRRAGASRDACRSNVQMRCTGGHHHRVAKGWAAAPLRGGSGIWGDQEDAASAAEDDPRPRSGLAPVSWRGESLGSCYLI